MVWEGLPEKVAFEQMFAGCAGVSNRDGRGTGSAQALRREPAGVREEHPDGGGRAAGGRDQGGRRDGLRGQAQGAGSLQVGASKGQPCSHKG